METFTSSSIYEESPAGDHPVSPSAVRLPYWRGVSAASVSSVSGRGSAATCVTTGGGVAATGAGATGSGTRAPDGGVGVGGGGASAFFEKCHRLGCKRQLHM